jgi:hypothetical protein
VGISAHWVSAPFHGAHKIKKNKLEPSEIEELKPDLLQILGLINEILN